MKRINLQCIPLMTTTYWHSQQLQDKVSYQKECSNVIGQYPDGNCVGFATCLIFEVYKNEKGEKWVEITLNDPFEDKEFKPTKEAQFNPIRNWNWGYYNNGCALSELTKRFAN